MFTVDVKQQYNNNNNSIDFEISKIDCISKENYFCHFNIKSTSESLETPSPSHFFQQDNFKCKIYTYAFGL